MIDVTQRMKFDLYKKLNPNELAAYQFRNIEKEMKKPDQKTISDEYLDFKLWERGFKSREEYFSEYLSKKLKEYQGHEILEVGCGRTGRLSRMLSEEGFIMTGIDPILELQGTENISFIKDKFDYKKTNISKYSYVVAQEPCDATEHIVRACVKQGVPFTISLCGVPHKLISGKMPRDVDEWYNYLLNISNYIVLRYINLGPLSKTPILKFF